MSWQSQPPYQTPDQRIPFDKVLQGSCHCERVKYWLSSDAPLACKFCHCDVCKTIHGAPCQWVAIFSKTHMAFETGTQHLRFYHSPTRHAAHELPCKVSCAYCGTLIMDEGRHMALLFPSLLTLDETQRRRFEVQCHIFYSNRIVDVPDGKPKWEGLDGKSRLLDLP